MRCLLVALALVSACGSSAPGTRALFDPRADLADPAHFYDLPFPSDLRLVNDHPGLAGMPRHDNEVLIEPMIAAAERERFWPVLPVVYFAFDAPVSPAHRDDGPIDAAFFVNVDPDSPERGRRIAALAHRLEIDPWVPGPMLALTPPPGQLLSPGTKWAAVLLRGYGDAEGAELGVPDALRALLHGSGDSRLQADFDALAETLRTMSVDLDGVAAATVFTTGDAIADVAERARYVVETFDAEQVSLGLDPDDGATHPRFCELHGVLRLPQFQAGTPPFDTGGGLVLDGEGRPVMQRMDEVPIAIAVPKMEMPSGGYAFVFYAHGTDGLSTQVIDRGPVVEPGGPQTVGEGPAHVLAAQGFASAGAATLLGPERLVEPRERAYLNLGNLAAYADTFEQAIYDIELVLEHLAGLALTDLEGCDGPTLPAGEPAFRFDLSRIGFMGQSAGAHMAAMVGAVDPRVAGIVPTGVGGYWSELLAVGSEVGGPPELFQLALGTRAELTPLHPGLNLLELAWERGEPLVYAERLAERPLAGHPRRHVYLPASLADSFHPEPVYDAMVVAYGLEQTGPELWPEMGDALRWAGLGRTDLPARGNRVLDGDATTLVVMQWEGDGLVDPHGVFGQRSEIKHQYGCFFRSLVDGGTPLVAVPAPEGSACE